MPALFTTDAETDDAELRTFFSVSDRRRIVLVPRTRPDFDRPSRLLFEARAPAVALSTMLERMS
jgi:hypothetical protein